MDIPWNCCNLQRELHVIGSTIAGTTWNKGRQAPQAAIQMQQQLNLNWILCSVTPDNMLLLLSCGMTITGCDRVNFLHNCLYGEMFCICDKNSKQCWWYLDTSAVAEAVITQHQNLLFLTLLVQQVSWECTRRWEGTQPAQLTTADQRDIPYCMTFCLAINTFLKVLVSISR